MATTFGVLINRLRQEKETWLSRRPQRRIDVATRATTGHNPRVLIDGREISKKRGIGHFCRELLYNINGKIGSTDTRYMCVVPSSTPSAILQLFGNIEFIPKKLIDPILWEQAVLPIVAFRRRASHLICPYNTFPIFSSPQLKRIIVYHDLIFLHGSRVGGSAKLFYGNKYRSLLLQCLKKTDMILAVSDYTRDTLRRFLGIDSVVIGNSCNHVSSLIADAPQLHGTGEYFLHIGGDALNKNTHHIVSCFIIARKMAGSNFPKLIVIGTSQKYADGLKKVLLCGDAVLFRYAVSDEEKSALIKWCLAVVFVSTAEGFGLPIIEGHAAGRRVITSRRRPMSDIASASDLLVSPRDKDELVAAYLEVAHRPDSCSPVPHDLEMAPDQFNVIESLLR